MAGGGCLAALSMAATVAYHVDVTSCEEVSSLFGRVWLGAGQPLLFGLLGASVHIDMLSAEDVRFGVGIVSVGLLFRAAAVCGCIRIGTDWTCWETAFAMVSWCPKATVQAALAGVALDYVQSHPEYAARLHDARLVLTTGALSIILTAPPFAIAMFYSGRAWLQLEPEVHAPVCDLAAPTSNAEIASLPEPFPHHPNGAQELEALPRLSSLMRKAVEAQAPSRQLQLGGMDSPSESLRESPLPSPSSSPALRRTFNGVSACCLTERSTEACLAAEKRPRGGVRGASRDRQPRSRGHEWV